MLDWLAGSSKITDDHSSLDEPPETPAHVFAVRAFKSAIFGTPAANPLSAVKSSQAIPGKENDLSREKESRSNQELLKSTTDSTSSIPEFVKKRPSLTASPAKGILVTPGTTTLRRKTVSFSRQASDKNDGREQTGAEESSGSGIMEETAIPSHLKLLKKDEDVRRSLFIDRDTKPASEAITHRAPTDSVNPPASNSDERDLGLQSADVTIDLKEPRSKSGQHWKEQYQRDHDMSKAEMKKLIRHSQVAKSYAARKDAEALQLTEKLRASESYMKEMEDRVKTIASRLGAHRGQSHDGVKRMDELMDDLATYMTQALHYKQKAEKYKLAIEEQNLLAEAGEHQNPGPERSAIEEEKEEEPWTDVRISGDVKALQGEMPRPEEDANKAKARVRELSAENDTLKQTLARVKVEMKNYEIRHRSWEERKKRKDARTTTEIQSLRDEILQLKHTHKLEIQALKATAARESIPAISETERHKQRNSITRFGFVSKPNVLMKAPNDRSILRKKVALAVPEITPHPLSRSPLEGDGLEKLAVALETNSDRTIARDGQPGEALRVEAMMNPTIKASRDRDLITKELSMADSINHHLQSSTCDLQNLDNKSAMPNTPLPEPLQLPSSLLPSPTAYHQLRSSRGKNTLISTSRGFSMLGSSRISLPPDRITAAKLRIEQRKRSQEIGKENETP